MQTTAATQPEIIYPETDGEPMAQNTKQAEVMMTLKENLDALFADRDDVFVAIGHFWYPVKGHPEIRQAPDVMVVLGRPKRHRGSYKQWEEEDIPPQVVFEVASPGNTQAEWDAKLAFYEQYGVLEYYTNRASEVHQLPPSLRFPPLREGNRERRAYSVPPACRGNLKEGVINCCFFELWLSDWYHMPQATKSPSTHRLRTC